MNGLINTQPFGKNNLLEKGWAKKQPFRKRLGQNSTKITKKFVVNNIKNK
jgi:hypothetical protein